MEALHGVLCPVVMANRSCRRYRGFLTILCLYISRRNVMVAALIHTLLSYLPYKNFSDGETMLCVMKTEEKRTG